MLVKKNFKFFPSFLSIVAFQGSFINGTHFNYLNLNVCIAKTVECLKEKNFKDKR
jgi:hypothetical protein